MKNILLPLISIFVLVSCKNQIQNKEVIDVITATDNSVTYADTIVTETRTGGQVIAQGDDTNQTDAIADTMMGAAPMTFMTTTDKNGKTICYGCSLHKTTNSSFFSLACSMSSPSFPINIMILNVAGPANGIGVFKSIAFNAPSVTDTTANKLGTHIAGNSFAETFKGGQEYRVDSVTVNVTKAEGKTVEGNYKMWVSSATGSKMISGNIINNTATIN